MWANWFEMEVVTKRDNPTWIHDREWMSLLMAIHFEIVDLLLMCSSFCRYYERVDCWKRKQSGCCCCRPWNNLRRQTQKIKLEEENVWKIWQKEEEIVRTSSPIRKWKAICIIFAIKQEVNLKKEDTLKEKEEDPVNNWLSIDVPYRTSNGWENCVQLSFLSYEFT
jgi:hypothetical protein